MNNLFEAMILDQKPKTKILSNSSSDGMHRFANISLALLRHGNIVVNGGKHQSSTCLLSSEVQ